MVETSTPVEVFCCYSRADETWLRKLETHLSLLKRQGLVSLWHDRLIAPGTEWADTIDIHLETASVILLLVSADFLASDYCYSVEMQRALERHAVGEASVVPILVRPVDWTSAPFAHLQVLPTDAKPLASWRSKEQALADVAAGIRRVIEDVPLLAASAPRAALPAIWNIPYPRNPFFQGRDDELAQLHFRLRSSQTTALSQPQAISGLGGIGKSQLALEYAYRYSQGYQAVLWARAESTEALASSYIAIATLLRLPEREAREQEVIVQAVKTWLQSHRDWLLILDNADELRLLGDFLPPRLEGHLLLTTRAAATGRLAYRLEIEALAPEQGALFLLRRAGLLASDAILEHASPQERELAMQISRELGGLPLALDQAGAYLEETGTNLVEYWQIYQQHRADLLRERRGLVVDHPEPVSNTWFLSFQLVEKKNSAAADLLRLCAFLSPDAIPEEIVTTGALFLGPVLAPVAGEAFLLNQALEALRAYSLIRRNPTEKTLSIHRLVQAVLQDTLEDEERRVWAGRAVHAVEAAFPQVEYDTWPQCERLLTQALVAIEWIEKYQMTDWNAKRLLYETASYLQDRARYAEAEPLYQRVLRLWEQQLGPDFSQANDPLIGLELISFQQVEPQQAQRLLEQRLGSEDPALLSRLQELMSLNRDQSKDGETEPLSQQTLHMLEQQLGPNHSQPISLPNGRSVIFYHKSMEATDSLDQDPHFQLLLKFASIASSLTTLAGRYSQRGNHFEAVALSEQARRMQLKPRLPSVASSLNGLASLYRDQGKYAEAASLSEQALRILEQHLGLEDPEVASSLATLASLYYQQGNYSEAEALSLRSLRILEQHAGSEYLVVASPLTTLASLYRDQGKYAEAASFSQRALRIREQQLGPEHPEVASSLNGLAGLYYHWGRYAEAEPLFQRALRSWELQLGPEHPNVSYALHGLANLYRDQGKYAEAESFFQRVLHIREQQLGSEHPETAEAMHDLARLRDAQDNSAEAKSWYARALAVREQTLGAHHPKTAETRKHLIALLHAMGQHEESAQFEAVQTEP